MVISLRHTLYSTLPLSFIVPILIPPVRLVDGNFPPDSRYGLYKLKTATITMDSNGGRD